METDGIVIAQSSFCLHRFYSVARLNIIFHHSAAHDEIYLIDVSELTDIPLVEFLSQAREVNMQRKEDVDVRRGKLAQNKIDTVEIMPGLALAVCMQRKTR